MKSSKTIIGSGVLVVIFLIFSSKTTVAQSIPGTISLNYLSIPSVGSSSFSNLDTQFSIPIVSKKQGILLGGLNYSRRPDILQGRKVYDLTLSTFAFNLSYIRPINPVTRMSITMNTGMYSDFEDITAEDFNTAVLVLLNNFGKNGFSYSYGLVYIRNFYGHSVLPFFGFSKSFSPAVQFNMMNPLNPKLTYAYSSTITYGIQGLFVNQDFRLTDKFQSLVYVDRSISAAPFVDLKMNNYSSLSFKVGYNFLQNTKVYEDVENSSAKWFLFSSNQDLLYERNTSGVFFEAGIQLRLPTKLN